MLIFNYQDRQQDFGHIYIMNEYEWLRNLNTPSYRKILPSVESYNRSVDKNSRLKFQGR